MNIKLDIKLRENKGRKIAEKYSGMFFSAGFNNAALLSISVPESDKIIGKARLIFPDITEEIELIAANSLSIHSRLLSSIKCGDADQCYIFSDDRPYCGMFLSRTDLALKYSLKVAKDGYSNTCFLLDKDFTFWFTINFYPDIDHELYNYFDIQRKLAPLAEPN